MLLKKFGVVAIVAILFFGRPHLCSAQTWTRGRGGDVVDVYWLALASSADGFKVAAAVAPPEEVPQLEPANLALSTNAGVTWNYNSAPTGYWSAIASSADASRLVATQDLVDGVGGQIYTSTNAGTTWASTTAPSNAWSAVSSSADGENLNAVSPNGAIYRSSNGGSSWSQSIAPSNCWFAIASSADGDRSVAVSLFTEIHPTNFFPGWIYRSTDSGNTWQKTTAPSNDWVAVASSADGSNLVAVSGISGISPNEGGGDGLIYRSSDAGSTWSPTSAPSSPWTAVVSSADGTKLTACYAAASSAQGHIYFSSDSGTTWKEPFVDPPLPHWTTLASAADGSKVVAGSVGLVGVLSIGPLPSFPQAPSLSIATTGTNLALSWLVPSTPSVLQEIPSLTPATWSDTTNLPALIFSNLNNQIIMAPSAGNAFFRLRQR